MTDWTKEEDEAFNDVEKNSNLGKQILRDIEGQPYHWDVYVSPSQRNQVIEECAQMCEKFGYENHHGIITDHIAKAIRGMKT
jgi:hypothetical protein